MDPVRLVVASITKAEALLRSFCIAVRGTHHEEPPTCDPTTVIPRTKQFPKISRSSMRAGVMRATLARPKIASTIPSAVRACVAAARARISPRPRRATSTGSDGHAQLRYFGYRDLGFPALQRQFWRVGRRHDRRGRTRD